MLKKTITRSLTCNCLTRAIWPMSRKATRGIERKILQIAIPFPRQRQMDIQIGEIQSIPVMLEKRQLGEQSTHHQLAVLFEFLLLQKDKAIETITRTRLDKRQFYIFRVYREQKPRVMNLLLINISVHQIIYSTPSTSLSIEEEKEIEKDNPYYGQDME